MACVALCDVVCVHVAGLTQVEGMWSVFTQATRGGECSRRRKGCGEFTQATRGGVCSRRWKGCGVFTQAEGMWSVHAGDDRWSVFTQVEGVWSVHAGGRDVECGNFLLESTFSADSYGVRTAHMHNRMYEYTYAR